VWLEWRVGGLVTVVSVEDDDGFAGGAGGGCVRAPHGSTVMGHGGRELVGLGWVACGRRVRR
jgi:hypothetical protein